MLQFINEIRNNSRLRWYKLAQYQPRHRIYHEVGNYILKTAENSIDLVECFKIRHDVFGKEFQGKPNNGLDFDRFDYHFDHLMIVNKLFGEVVGTYRLSPIRDIRNSYIANEFDLGPLENLDGSKIELGRACIRKEFRKTTVLNLLWKGIGSYLDLSNATILFGGSSIRTSSCKDAALIYQYLKESELLDKELVIYPKMKYQFSNFSYWQSYFADGLGQDEIKTAETLIPPLLWSYFKAGAKISSFPAFDESFNCVDFLTVAKVSNIRSSHLDRFRLAN